MTPIPGRRQLLQAAGALAPLLTLSPFRARAQAYPSRPVTVIVPQAVGSASDNVMRPIAQVLTQSLGQPFVVDNRGAASGLVGMSQAARADADGHTLVVISNTTIAANPSLFRKLPYDPRAFAPIAILGRTSMMLVVPAESSLRTLDDLLTDARQRSVPLTIGHGSSTARVALQMLTGAAGLTVNAIPYQGTPKLMNDLLGRNLDAGVVDAGAGLTQARAGKVRPLVISGSSRMKEAADVPTLAERWPGSALDSWIALAAPAGTASPVIERLHGAITRALEEPEVRRAFAAVSIQMDSMSTADLERLIRADSERWPALIRAAGIQPE